MIRTSDKDGKAYAIQAASLLQRFGSIRNASDHCNRSYGWIQKWLRRGHTKGWINLAAKSENALEITPEEMVQRSKASMVEKEKESENAKVRKFLEEENEKLKQMLGIKADIKDLSFDKIPTYKAAPGQAIACAVASDWHAGERVDRADVPGGRNEYTPAIFERRARNFFQRALYLTNSISTGPNPLGKVETMALFLLGDLITGWLHDDQKETNWLTPTQEFVLVYRVIVEGIDYLLREGEFSKLVIVTADGNHDRTTDYMRVKNQSQTSFSNMMYRMLKMEFDKRGAPIDWHIAEGYTNYVQLGTTIVRAHHGDGFQYGGGVGGFDIPLNKAIPRWNTSKHADLDVFGHWHTLRHGSNYISNGSLIGHGAYSTKCVRASFEDPKQAFFALDHKRKGVAMFAPIYTEKNNEPN